MILLINPPLVKPSEPPPGLAKLAGALNTGGVPCQAIDANVEGILHLLGGDIATGDTWSRRARKNLPRNLEAMRRTSTYASIDRYARSVGELNRAFGQSVEKGPVHVTLGDFRDEKLSPVRSDDLKAAAAFPERNPFYGYFSRRLREAVERGQPSVIGLSVNYLSQGLTTFSIIGYLRREFPGISIVLGGGLVTSWLRSSNWQNPFEGLVDRLIAGPGERALLGLAGKDAPPGTGFPPDYTPFPDNGYLSPGFVLPFSGSFGCHWSRCSFCPERAEGSPFTALPAGTAARQLSELARLLHPSLIHLTDNAVSPALLKELTVHPPGVPWYGFVRCTGDLTSPDFAFALKKSGCAMLKLGLESGSQKVLDGMAKGIRLEEVSLALRNLQRAGIATYVYLLFGTPYEGPAEALKTLDFVCSHKEEITFLNVAVFNLPVNAPEAPSLTTKPFYEGDLSLYLDFVHPAGWNRTGVRRFIDREFRRNPVVQEILRRDPPIFSSLHAPFFAMEGRRESPYDGGPET